MKLFRFIKLNNIHEKSGAGEEGTNELVNQYLSNSSTLIFP